MKKIVVMMVGENIFGRELIRVLLERNLPLAAIIIEKGSKRSQTMLDYLKNDFYNPPSLSELLVGRQVKIFEVDNLNGENCRTFLESLAPDLVLLGGSSRIIKPEIIKTSQTGIMNAHPGLLPDYKGRDVVGWAIYNGDSIGATCHLIDEGVDTGPILLQERASYAKGETLLGIRVRIMKLCADLMSRSVLGLMNSDLQPVAQLPDAGKTYGPMSPEAMRAAEEKLKK